MINIKKYIPITIIAIALVLLVIVYFNMNDIDGIEDDKNEEIITQLRSENNTLKSEIGLLSQKINQLEKEANNILGKIKLEESNIIILNKIKNEEFKTIDNYSIDAVIEFFAKLDTSNQDD